jgi:hypothetical protein
MPEKGARQIAAGQTATLLTGLEPYFNPRYLLFALLRRGGPRNLPATFS